MSESSALEYARFHGLAKNYSSKDILDSLSELTYVLVEDDALLPDPQFSAFASGLQEPKLQLTQLERNLLAESISHSHSAINWDNLLPDLRLIKKLRIEEPILARDHETDVAHFKRDVWTCSDPVQLWEGLPQIELTVDRDFEEEWNDILTGRTLRDVGAKLKEEKIKTTREALVHLSNLLRDGMTKERKEEVLQSFLVPVKKPRSRSLTPLMTPDETSPEPSIPSSPDLEFPLRSEEDVDLDDLLLQVEKQMQEEDRILSDEFHNASPTRATRLFREAQNSPNMKFEEERQFEPICRTFGHQRQPRRDLEKIKLEVPMPSSPLSVEKTIRANPIEPGSFRSSESELLPELHDSSSELKSSDSNQKKGQELFDLYVDMNDINVSIEENRLSAIAIDHEAAHLGPELSQDPNDELEQPAEEAAAHVIRDFQQVEIIDPAACLKLAVPELDSVPFTPLWEDSRNETLTRSLDSGCLTLPDPLDVKRESDFNWAPFPSGFMELHMTEEVEDCGRFQDITMTPQGILRSDQMLWKQPGLRVLDTEDESDNELDEDDELILAMSMPSLPLVPRKRLDHDFDEALSLEVRKASELFSRNASNKLTSSKTLEKFKNGFSASQALETFLDLRGSKFKNITIPPSTDELLEDPIQATQFDAKSGSETQITEDHIPKTVAIDQETRDPVTTQVPLTPLHNPLNDGGHVLQSTSTLRWPRTVVIETAMLQRNRSIVDFLETKVGDRFSLLYRDMSNCELQGQDRYSTAPDIILNPRTGLMFTSFQALNQKRLPGQGQAADQGLVHSKIHQLADNYAQLIVLVTSPSVSASLSQTQVDSISSFTAFCCRLSDQAAVHVNPIWVSASSEFPTMEAAVNKYTWDLIDQHAFPKSPPSKESLWRVPLIHEETVWESFLRKVGLNPMSAQIVLGMLKRPDPSRGSRDSWGLRKFVQMSHDQRASIFGELLGVKLLDRVNEVLEKRSS